MGWFGVDMLDGDQPLDCKDELFHILNIDTSKMNYCQIKDILNKNQDKIYDWLRDYDWEKLYPTSPGFIQQVYSFAVIRILLNYGITLSTRGIKGIMQFVDNDILSKYSSERREIIDKFREELYKQPNFEQYLLEKDKE